MFLLYACHNWQVLKNHREQPECADTQRVDLRLRQDHEGSSSERHSS